MAAKTLKNPHRLQTVTFKINLPRKGRKPKYGKKNQTLRFQWFSVGDSILVAESEKDNWEIYHRPILAVYLKYFFCR